MFFSSTNSYDGQIVKKVRLDVTEEVKKVKIDENAASQPEIGGHKVSVLHLTGCTLESCCELTFFHA